ncbi:S-layer homology domain-containing protein [Paenibacillus sp. HB172176]|uniref:S-layer homology domain-containing protein n=1 Tax=Paenibacillus sp. HB172176 TaxID=2493690 RepID=UPI00143B3A8C|nr:S-layer homology domain-containing protein [Paenibacillus sp. HB172176]
MMNRMMMKKWIVVSLLLTLSFPMIANRSVEAGEEVSFKDTAKHWAKEQIETAVQKGYVNGFPNGTFKPDQPVTAAEFIKMIVTALGLPHETESGAWYSTYVKAAAAAEIYQGNDDFAEGAMNDKLPRRYMAWLAVRAADDSLLTVESSGIKRDAVIDRWPMTAEDNKITRSDEDMRNYYEGFLVSEAFKRGILTGFGGNDIGLDWTTTRAQAVTVIERILTLRDGGQLPSADKYAIGESELAWLKTNAFIVAPQIFDDPNGVSMKGKYKLENLSFQNSMVHTEISRILLIDLDDPKDPYRNLLPATEKLGFRDGNIGRLPTDAYAMYIEYETLSNSNPRMYWGDLSYQTLSYVQPDPFPFNKLVQPSYLYTEEKSFENTNSNWFPENGLGKNVTVIAIPNSGYTLQPRIGEDVGKEDRGLYISIYIDPAFGDDDIRNRIFNGTTTHYDH